MSLARESQFPALNVQAPWAELLISGRKTVETRNYPMPTKYVGVPILIFQTPGRQKNVRRGAVGLAWFAESFCYPSIEAFDGDYNRHLVAKDSPDFAWNTNSHKMKWGWPINKAVRFEEPFLCAEPRGIVFTRQVTIPADVSGLLGINEGP